MSSFLRSPKSPLSPKNRNNQLVSILLLGGIIIIVSSLAFLIWYLYVAQHLTPSIWGDDASSAQNKAAPFSPPHQRPLTPLPTPTLDAQIDQEENAVVEIEESKNTPLVSIFKEQEKAAHQPSEKVTPSYSVPKSSFAKRFSLVIDTYGGTPLQLQKLARLNLPLTISIVPFDPHASDFIKIARTHGLEIIADIPMEPIKSALDPGPHALRTGQSAHSMRAEIKNSLKKIPSCSGAKNRMGSKFTANAASMEVFFAAFPAHPNFFFLDALTGKSVAKKSATKAHIPYIQRTLFIDNVPTHEKIMSQLRVLQRLATQQSSSPSIKKPTNPIVGLGNLRPETMRALEAWVKERNTVPPSQPEIVPLSQLLGLDVQSSSPPFSPSPEVAT